MYDAEVVQRDSTGDRGDPRTVSTFHVGTARVGARALSKLELKVLTLAGVAGRQIFLRYLSILGLALFGLGRRTGMLAKFSRTPRVSSGASGISQGQAHAGGLDVDHAEGLDVRRVGRAGRLDMQKVSMLLISGFTFERHSF